MSEKLPGNPKQRKTPTVESGLSLGTTPILSNLPNSTQNMQAVDVAEMVTGVKPTGEQESTENNANTEDQNPEPQQEPEDE